MVPRKSWLWSQLHVWSFCCGRAPHQAAAGWKLLPQEVRGRTFCLHRGDWQGWVFWCDVGLAVPWGAPEEWGFPAPRAPWALPSSQRGRMLGEAGGCPPPPQAAGIAFLPNVRKTEMRLQVRSGNLIQNKCVRPQYVWYVQYSFEA